MTNGKNLTAKMGGGRRVKEAWATDTNAIDRRAQTAIDSDVNSHQHPTNLPRRKMLEKTR